jgi:hypothetical protein
MYLINLKVAIRSYLFFKNKKYSKIIKHIFGFLFFKSRTYSKMIKHIFDLQYTISFFLIKHRKKINNSITKIKCQGARSVIISTEQAKIFQL